MYRVLGCDVCGTNCTKLQIGFRVPKDENSFACKSRRKTILPKLSMHQLWIIMSNSNKSHFMDKESCKSTTSLKYSLPQKVIALAVSLHVHLKHFLLFFYQYFSSLQVGEEGFYPYQSLNLIIITNCKILIEKTNK